MFRAEILCVGNELLIGKTTNTNLTWLSGQLAHLGGIVRRALVVRDEISEIAEALTQILEHKPDLVLISGGLGPTFDDKTLQGLAYKLGVPLQLDKIGLRMVRTKVKELNPARLKMAHIPEESRPLMNLVGTAPGVYLSVGSIHIFALPGVPSEMRSIFKNSVIKFLETAFELGTLYDISLIAVGVPESMIAPFIEECMAQYPDVYVKSHPLGIEEGRSKINLHLTSQRSERAVGDAAKMLVRKIRALGGVAAFDTTPGVS